MPQSYPYTGSVGTHAPIPFPSRAPEPDRPAQTIDDRIANHGGVVAGLRRAGDWLMHGLLPTIAKPVLAIVTMYATARVMTGGLQSTGASPLAIVLSDAFALAAEITFFVSLHRWRGAVEHQDGNSQFIWGTLSALFAVPFAITWLIILQQMDGVPFLTALANVGFANPFHFYVLRVATLLGSITTLTHALRVQHWQVDEAIPDHVLDLHGHKAAREAQAEAERQEQKRQLLANIAQDPARTARERVQAARSLGLTNVTHIANLTGTTPKTVRRQRGNARGQILSA